MTPPINELAAAFQLAERGNRAEAIRRTEISFRQAIASGDKGWISTIGGMLGVYCDTEEYRSQAVGYLSEVVAHVPDDRLAWYALGDAASRIGDANGADAAFRKSLTLSLQENDARLLELLATRGYAPDAL
jgi:tetratricopeptide (TPR) repeat protein